MTDMDLVVGLSLIGHTPSGLPCMCVDATLAGHLCKLVEMMDSSYLRLFPVPLSFSLHLQHWHCHLHRRGYFLDQRSSMAILLSFFYSALEFDSFIHCKM